MVKSKNKVVKAEEKPAEVIKEPEEPKEEFKGVVSLGTSTKMSVGRNKCGMPWKKNSKRSAFSKGPPISY